MKPSTVSIATVVEDESGRDLHAVPDIGIGQQIGVPLQGPSQRSGAFGLFAL